MSLLALAALAFGTCDLFSGLQATAASQRLQGRIIAAAAVFGFAMLIGLAWWKAAWISLVLLAILWVRPNWDRSKPNDRRAAGLDLLIIGLTLLVAFALSGEFRAVHGPFAHWFYDLPLAGASHVDATQALLGIAATTFLLTTSNRIVCATLVLAGNDVVVGKHVVAGRPPTDAEGSQTPAEDGSEDGLKGGRFIGAAERLIVAGMLVAGSTAGAGIVIAAKGVIRLPELRSNRQERHGAPDEIAEYFLIGTLTSIAIAAIAALLLLATG